MEGSLGDPNPVCQFCEMAVSYIKVGLLCPCQPAAGLCPGASGCAGGQLDEHVLAAFENMHTCSRDPPKQVLRLQKGRMLMLNKWVWAACRLRWPTTKRRSRSSGSWTWRATACPSCPPHRQALTLLCSAWYLNDQNPHKCYTAHSAFVVKVMMCEKSRASER